MIAGYGLLGPPAMNCAAPDEGNMHMLDVIADAGQRRRYLEPLASGEIRSCFAMTEPAPGAGADPSMLRTRADRVFAGGHAEVRFDDCRVDEGAVLGAVGEGFRHAQVRLAPARLTHCMRWLGAARRAHDFALARATSREAFGSLLGRSLRRAATEGSSAVT